MAAVRTRLPFPSSNTSSKLAQTPDLGWLPMDKVPLVLLEPIGVPIPIVTPSPPPSGLIEQNCYRTRQQRPHNVVVVLGWLPRCDQSSLMLRGKTTSPSTLASLTAEGFSPAPFLNGACGHSARSTPEHEDEASATNRDRSEQDKDKPRLGFEYLCNPSLVLEKMRATQRMRMMHEL